MAAYVPSPILGDEMSNKQQLSAGEFKALLGDRGDDWQHLPKGRSNSWDIFWRKEGSSSSNHELEHKFTLVLKQVASECFRSYSLLQFWVPTWVRGRWQLTMQDQPFATASHLYKGLSCYRKECRGYSYSVEQEELMGPIGRVFKRPCVESSPDIRLYTNKDHPLRDAAVRSGFRGYIAFPVYHLRQSQCLGVLEWLDNEYSTPASRHNFAKLQVALEAAGLTTTHFNPLQMDSFWHRRQNEFSELLEVAIDAVPELHLAQVWVPCVLCGNLKKPFDCMERVAYVTVNKVNFNSFKYSDKTMSDFLHACRFNTNPSTIGISRFLSSPRINATVFCRNIGDLSMYVYPLAHYARLARLSFHFAIDLVKKEDENDHCVIEFFLHLDSTEEKNPFPLLKLLLQMIESKLKAYKLSSGRNFEAELPVEISTKSKVPLSIDFKEYTQELGCQNSKEVNMLSRMIERDEDISLSTLNARLKKVELFIEESEEENYIFSSLQRRELLEYPYENKLLISKFDETRHKIKLLLHKLRSGHVWVTSEYLVQFWAVKWSDDKSYLETIDQPFVLGCLSKGLCEYRNRCMDHQFCLDKWAKEEELGPPGRVYQNRYPESTRNLRGYSSKEFPLRDYAVHCGLDMYMSLPVFCLKQNECIGVLEFIGSYPFDDSMEEYEEFKIFSTIKRSMEEAKLRSAHIGPQMLEDYVDEQKLALNEVKEMLTVAIEIPLLVGAHIWVPCNQCIDENCMQRAPLKDEDSEFGFGWNPLSWLENKFHKVITGRGPIGTLMASENKMCFCENLCDFSITEQTGAHDHARLSRLKAWFAIGLQSSYTRNRQYVLEFFLDEGCRNSELFCTFLGYLLPLMKEKLKSFKVASGKQLGEQWVIDVITFGQTTEFEQHEPSVLPVRFKSFHYGQDISEQQRKHHISNSGRDIMEGGLNDVSHINKEQEVAIASKQRGKQTTKASIDISLNDFTPHFSKKLTGAEKEPGVTPSTIKKSSSVTWWPFQHKFRTDDSLLPTPNSDDQGQSSKRQEIDESSSNSTSPSNSPSPQHILATNTGEQSQSIAKSTQDEVVIIKARFKNDTAKIQLKVSSKMKHVNQQVARRFNIEIGSFKLKYFDDDKEWILLACDDDLHLCMNNSKATGKNNVVRVFVESNPL